MIVQATLTRVNASVYPIRTWGAHNRSWCRRYNTAPTGITMVGGTVAENARDALVGTLVTTDIDVVDVFSYTLADSDGGRFELRNGNEVFCMHAFDFETTNATSIVVTSTDKGNDTITVTLAIRILDVAEAPTGIFYRTGGDIYENATAGAVVGTIGVDDQDNGDTHTIIVLVPQVHFSINGNALEYRRMLSTFLNYEVAQNVTVTLHVTDSVGLTLDSTMVISILDANDAPVVMTSTVVADESATVGTVVHTIACVMNHSLFFRCDQLCTNYMSAVEVDLEIVLVFPSRRSIVVFPLSCYAIGQAPNGYSLGCVY